MGELLRKYLVNAWYRGMSAKKRDIAAKLQTLCQLK